MTISPVETGRRALDHLDKVLEERPEKNGHELSAALRCLAEFRDAFIAARRRDPLPAYAALIESINGVISSVMAAQFPLGDIQWDELVKARDWLSGAVESSRLSGLRNQL
jgi:hypothetical protein